MFLGIQNAVLFHWKHIELKSQSTCKLKNGWDNGCQSYSFKDSCVISTWSNFSCGFRVLHETNAILFFGWPKPCFSPVSPVSPFEFVYSLYTFSSPICRDFARALRKLCSLPPSMSNRYALSVRDKKILASGHYYVRINGWCSLQSRPPQIGPQSLNRRFASFLLFC